MAILWQESGLYSKSSICSQRSPCDLFERAPQLAASLARNSDTVLAKLDHCIDECQRLWMRSPSIASIDSLSAERSVVQGMQDEATLLPHQTFKHHVHARLGPMPAIPELCRPNVSSIRATDVGMFLQVTGTVIRTGSIRMLESACEFECAKKGCGFRFTVHADVEQDNTMELPQSCPSPDGKCNGRKFMPVPGTKLQEDYQEVKI